MIKNREKEALRFEIQSLKFSNSENCQELILNGSRSDNQKASEFLKEENSVTKKWNFLIFQTTVADKL